MSAQFFEEWNSVFDYKLRESDLQNPTEAVLFGALSSYLEHININVTKMREESMQDEKSQLQFKVEFCTYVDRVFKISKPQEQFLCYDLMHPTSKKTIYLLKMLLNFYHFYNMIKVQVEEKSDDLVTRFEAAVSDRDKCAKSNQAIQEKIDRIGEEFSILAETIPNLQKSVENLKKSNVDIDDRINKVQDLLTQAKLDNIAYQQKNQELQNSEVTAHQVYAVRENLAKLDEEYAELCEIEESTLEGKTVSNAMMKSVDANVESMDTFIKKYSVDDATSSKFLETKVNALKRKISEAVTLHSQLQSQITVKSNEYKQIKLQLEEQSSTMGKANVSDDRAMSKLLQQEIELTAALSKLADKLKQNESIVDRLNQQHEFVVRGSREVLERIRTSKYCV